MAFKMRGFTPFHQEKEKPSTHIEKQAEIRKYNPFCNVCYGNRQSHAAKVRNGDVKPHEYLEEGGFYTNVNGDKIEVPPQK